MAIISKKKIVYPISDNLRNYLIKYSREVELPIAYVELQRYDNSVPLYDGNQNDTLWETVFYPQSEMEHIHEALKKIYALMKSLGDMTVIDHLYIDRIDLCVYGNTQPFRIRVVNEINDNFDYFYIKTADASRLYGLELEHLLSPNRIGYLVHHNTLVEEHIVGIPADQFIKTRMNDSDLNKIRLAKEFVKFNERCFVRLLGDMHSSNFVVDITPDFEEVVYRLRPIDFDQQSYEGRSSIYFPKYFKENNPIIQLGIDMMTNETMRQYQREERSNISYRIQMGKKRVDDLLETMAGDRLAPKENLRSLRGDLADFYHDKRFLNCQSMGELVRYSLEILVNQPQLYSEKL